MFFGFVDEEADTFAMRVSYDGQTASVNHLIDHSVASLVNVIDGIGNSTNEISLLVSYGLIYMYPVEILKRETKLFQIFR